MNREHIRNLLADCVDTKLAYWDANGALEKALAGDDISDHDANEIHDMIDILAAGADDGGDVTIEHVDDLIKQLHDLPTT